jgi:hypothetical protein
MVGLFFYRASKYGMRFINLSKIVKTKFSITRNFKKIPNVVYSLLNLKT